MKAAIVIVNRDLRNEGRWMAPIVQETTLTIDGRTSAESAWVKIPGQDDDYLAALVDPLVLRVEGPAFLNALKAGRRLSATAILSGGRVIRHGFSLMGFTRAWNAVEARCDSQ
jgi:hypothetical protein